MGSSSGQQSPPYLLIKLPFSPVYHESERCPQRTAWLLSTFISLSLWLSGLLMMEAWNESVTLSFFWVLYALPQERKLQLIQPVLQTRVIRELLQSERRYADVGNCERCLCEATESGVMSSNRAPSWVLQTSRSCSLIFCRSYVSTGKFWIAIFWNIHCGMWGTHTCFKSYTEAQSFSALWETLPDHLTEERWFSTLGCKQ